MRSGDTWDFFKNITTLKVALLTPEARDAETLFDLCDPHQMWIYLPIIGPSSMFAYLDIVRLTEPLESKRTTIDLREIAVDMGINMQTTQRAIGRMVAFKLASLQPDDHEGLVLGVQRYAPIVREHRLQQQPPAWVRWYQDVETIVSTEHGITVYPARGATP